MKGLAVAAPIAALLAGAAVGAVAWREAVPPPARVAAPSLGAPGPAIDLPVPPIPPRIAGGAQYEHCLGLLAADPRGAVAYAAGWSGGGDGAAQCRAMALIALGQIEEGAGAIEALAASSHAPAVARAALFGQADQAWMIGDRPDRAWAAADRAVGLSPDDPDLRVDRAVAATALGHFQDAVADLDLALDADQRRGDALVFRAVAWRRLGHPELARDDVLRALAVDPNDPDALEERKAEGSLP